MSLNAEKREQALRDEVAELKSINGTLLTVLSQYIDGYDAEEISHFGGIDINQAIIVEQLLAKGGE